MAAVRAAHQLLDGEPKILADAPIVQLIGPSAVERIAAQKDRLQSRAARALRAHVVTRSRFAEDRLAEAVRRGVRQYVLLGAGLDTFALRQPDWARSLRIVEIDLPASQTAKRELLTVAGFEVPSNVVFAPVDLEHVALRDALSNNGVDLAAPVFLSWLGVTMYLTESAVDATFRAVSALAAGTEIVYTFAQPRADTGDDGLSLADHAAALGEPWLSYLTPDGLDAKLRSFGFSNVYFLTPAEAHSLYFADRTDGLAGPTRTSIGGAIV